MKYWYCLHTKPNSEYVVANLLEQRGITVYLPRVSTPETEHGRQSSPFFPCYLFANIDFQVVDFSSVQWTPGLRRFVAFMGQPVPVPAALIDKIRYAEDKYDATRANMRHNFEPGETVRVTAGPLQDMFGLFEGPTTPSKRVEILLDIVGRLTRTQIDVTDLEKMSAVDGKSSTKRPRRTRGRGRRIS